MNEEQANAAIGEALGDLGAAARQPIDRYQDERYAAVKWDPAYVWSVDNSIWAIELSRGDRVPVATISSMINLREADPTVQLAFFVPEGEPVDHLRSICRENRIAIVAKVADHYEVLESAAAIREPAIARIPGWVTQRLQGCQNLEAAFRSVIISFCKKYERLAQAGASDEDQENLLRKTFLSLLKANANFAAEYTPLKLLRFFEQSNLRQSQRDHYFHTFNNFLLGCIVLDECHAAFEEFSRSALRGAECSSEYVWLLTVLFHDVGYPIQKREETLAIIYGVPGLGSEQANAERREAWDCPQYRRSRVQLASLYDHLTQARITSAWTADPFDVPENHPLDKALQRSFLEKGHGAASCLRMLADFFRKVPEAGADRQFLIRHVFLAGLSIPFHDWPVRKFLRDLGVQRIRTSRFPFAALLMFVDSIQEDRRGEAQAPDMLTGITIEGNRVTAQIQFDQLPGEKLSEKKREAQDVKSFLEEDLLQFDYPGELLV
jgi:hypothetical protein